MSIKEKIKGSIKYLMVLVVVLGIATIYTNLHVDNVYAADENDLVICKMSKENKNGEIESVEIDKNNVDGISFYNSDKNEYTLILDNFDSIKNGLYDLNIEIDSSVDDNYFRYGGVYYIYVTVRGNNTICGKCSNAIKIGSAECVVTYFNGEGILNVHDEKEGMDLIDATGWITFDGPTVNIDNREIDYNTCALKVRDGVELCSGCLNIICCGVAIDSEYMMELSGGELNLTYSSRKKGNDVKSGGLIDIIKVEDHIHFWNTKINLNIEMDESVRSIFSFENCDFADLEINAKIRNYNNQLKFPALIYSKDIYIISMNIKIEYIVNEELHSYQDYCGEIIRALDSLTITGNVNVEVSGNENIISKIKEFRDDKNKFAIFWVSKGLDILDEIYDDYIISYGRKYTIDENYYELYSDVYCEEESNISILVNGKDYFKIDKPTEDTYSKKEKTKKPIRISKVGISLKNNIFTYEGKEIFPEIDLKGLIPGKDVIVTYVDNNKLGVGKVVVEGIGDYCSKKTLWFYITGKVEKVKKGMTFVKDGMIYKVIEAPCDVVRVRKEMTNDGEDIIPEYETVIGRVALIGIKKKKAKKLEIWGAVSYGGEVYRIDTIGNKAFMNMKKLKKLVIRSGSLKKIGNKAFCNCKKLKSVVMYCNRLVEIRSKAFYKCEKLDSLKFEGEKISKIGNKAFYKKVVDDNYLFIYPSIRVKRRVKRLLKKSNSKGYKIP